VCVYIHVYVYTHTYICIYICTLDLILYTYVNVCGCEREGEKKECVYVHILSMHRWVAGKRAQRFADRAPRDLCEEPRVQLLDCPVLQILKCLLPVGASPHARARRIASQVCLCVSSQRANYPFRCI